MSVTIFISLSRLSCFLWSHYNFFLNFPYCLQSYTSLNYLMFSVGIYNMYPLLITSYLKINIVQVQVNHKNLLAIFIHAILFHIIYIYIWYNSHNIMLLFYFYSLKNLKNYNFWYYSLLFLDLIFSQLSYFQAWRASFSIYWGVVLLARFLQILSENCLYLIITFEGHFFFLIRGYVYWLERKTWM